jgi:hypothetical protein
VEDVDADVCMFDSGVVTVLSDGEDDLIVCFIRLRVWSLKEKNGT